MMMMMIIMIMMIMMIMMIIIMMMMMMMTAIPMLRTIDPPSLEKTAACTVGGGNGTVMDSTYSK